MTLAAYVGWLCEEFRTVPSVILREIALAPDGFLEEIAETRAYSRAYAVIEAKDRPEGQEPGPSAMELLVRQIEADLAQEEMDKQLGRDRG